LRGTVELASVLSTAGLKLTRQTELPRDSVKAFSLCLALGLHLLQRGSGEKVIFHVAKITLQCLPRIISLGPPCARGNPGQALVQRLGNADDTVSRDELRFPRSGAHVIYVADVT